MYVSVPKNYSGNAFGKSENLNPRQPRYPQSEPPSQKHFTSRVRHTPPQKADDVRYGNEPDERDGDCREQPFSEPPCDGKPPCENECENECEKQPCVKSPCGDCGKGQKNPLSCIFEGLRNRSHSGLDTEDFLILGLIVLLMGKTGNEDIVLILAMLLLL